MQLDRVDLADIRAPRLIAETIHRHLGRIGPPVDVVEIAKALDIESVREANFDGFEGMLLTDRVRTRGAILANTRHGRGRTRYTIAHELGHFLLEQHEFSLAEGFACRVDDMRITSGSKKYLKQEAEANRFAAELLMPPHLFDSYLDISPDLHDAQRARDEMDVSLEAAIRRLVDRHPERLAAIWSRHGRIRYFHKSDTFPWITCNRGDSILADTVAARSIANEQSRFTQFVETHPLAWISDPDADLWEQTRVGRDGHAVTLLWASLPEKEPEAERDHEEPELPRFRQSGRGIGASLFLSANSLKPNFISLIFSTGFPVPAITGKYPITSCYWHVIHGQTGSIPIGASPNRRNFPVFSLLSGKTGRDWLA